METIESIMEESIKLNDVFYTKEQILNNEELKKEFIKYVQYERKKQKCREYKKTYVEKNKEKIREYSRKYMRDKYNSDPIFREKVLERKRVKPEDKKPMGRPLKYDLDNELNLIEKKNLFKKKSMVYYND